MWLGQKPNLESKRHLAQIAKVSVEDELHAILGPVRNHRMRRAEHTTTVIRLDRPLGVATICVVRGNGEYAAFQKIVHWHLGRKKR